MSVLNCLIVGSGNMAKEHTKVVLSHPNFNFVGMIARNTEAAHKILLDFGTTESIVYKNITDISDFVTVDLITVCVSEVAALILIKQILNRGYEGKILMEKPIGVNYDEASAFNDLCANANIIVAMNRRYYQSVISARQLITKDNAPRTICVIDQELPNNKRPEIVQKNWMYANSIHLIDLARFLARGEVMNINTVSQYSNKNFDYHLSFIRFTTGDVIRYEAFWGFPSPWSVNIIIPSVNIELKPIENLSYTAVNTRNTQHVKLDPIDITFKPGLYKMYDSIHEVHVGGGGHVVSVQDAFESVKLVKGIYGF